MKRILIYMLLLITFSELYSQGLYNNGAKIVVSSGAYLNIVGSTGNILNTTNGTNGAISLNGTLKVEGNITNNATAADVITSSTATSNVILSGTTAQNLSGSSTVPFVFPNLTINNAAGVSLSKDVTINGTLTLTTGLVDIGNNNFTFGSTSTITGTPSATNMIISSGTGNVQKVWSATGSFTYPIGEKTLTTNYLPVSLGFTTGTFAPGAITSINMVNTKYNDPTITGSYLNRFWNISQTGISAFASNLVFQYLPTDVSGTETSICTLRVLPTPFTTFNSANTIQHQLSATGVSAFGTYTGGLSTDKTLNLSSIMLEGLYNGGGTMRQAYNDLGPQWPAGIADHVTVELHDAITYATIVYSVANVPLSTTGTAKITIPGIYGGSYYITIKHRNSLETTTATAISFSNNIINQSLGALSDVFGGNLVQMVDSHYAIFGGDVNQDRFIDISDFISVDNLVSQFGTGYLPEDVNGDGFIDISDFITIDNNVSSFASSSLP